MILMLKQKVRQEDLARPVLSFMNLGVLDFEAYDLCKSLISLNSFLLV